MTKILKLIGSNTNAIQVEQIQITRVFACDHKYRHICTCVHVAVVGGTGWRAVRLRVPLQAPPIIVCKTEPVTFTWNSYD